MIQTQFAFTITKENSIDDYYNTLSQWGIAIIPQFVTGEQLVGLETEFDTCMTFEAPWAVHTDYSLGQQVRLNRVQIDRSIFPKTLEFF